MKDSTPLYPLLRQFLSVNPSDKNDWEHFLSYHCHASPLYYNIPTQRQAKCNSCNLCERSIFITEQKKIHSLAKAFLEENQFKPRYLETINNKLEQLVSRQLIWQYTDLSRLEDQVLGKNTSPDNVAILDAPRAKNILGEIYLSLSINICAVYSPTIPIDKRFLTASKLQTIQRFHWLFLRPVGRPYGSFSQEKDAVAREMYQIREKVRELNKAKGITRKPRKGRSRYSSIYHEIARNYESKHGLEFGSIAENTVKSLVKRGEKLANNTEADNG